MTHWLNRYIGKPYRRGCQGPEAFDCWGFVQWVLTHHYGHSRATLDNLEALMRLSSSHWLPLDHPEGGAVVMMEMASCPHVGIWVDSDQGGIAHCMEEYGVLFTPLSRFPVIGCRLLSFYGSAKTEKQSHSTR